MRGTARLCVAAPVLLLTPLSTIDHLSVERSRASAQKMRFQFQVVSSRGLEMYQNNRRINYGIQSFQWFPGNGLIDKSNVFTKTARKVSRDNFITHS